VLAVGAGSWSTAFSVRSAVTSDLQRRRARHADLVSQTAPTTDRHAAFRFSARTQGDSDVIASAEEDVSSSLFVGLLASNFAQKRPNGFARNFQRRLAMDR